MDFDLNAEKTDAESAKEAAPRLAPIPAAEPDSHWEGRLRGERGSAENANIPVAMRLSLRGGMITGQGRSPEFPYDAGDDQRTFTVTGQRNGATMMIDIWFDHDFIGRCAFALTGTIDAEEREITGSWTWQCKRECDCGGSTGRFALTRVDEPA